MREFSIILIIAAILGGGGWAMLEHMQAQGRKIQALEARVEQAARLSKSEDEATTKVVERQTTVVREASRAKAQIAQIMGTDALVPADAWSVVRDAIERMRGQAGSGSDDRNADLAS